MDEVWERAVNVARGGEEASSVRSLTLDGAVKGPHVRLPSPYLFEQFSQLHLLSIASVGLTSLLGFPSLPQLERLILSDNRICGGLESLVEAGLVSLRDLDLSNNKIQGLEDINPLARLNIRSLDLYKCPVTCFLDYRTKVFSLVKSLQYLDKVDADGNERLDSDEEEEDDDEDEEEDVGDDFGDDAEDGEKPGAFMSSIGAEDEDEVDNDDDNDNDGDESVELNEEDDTARYHAVWNHVSHRKNDSGSEEEVDDEDDEDEVEVQEIEEEDVGDDGNNEDDEAGEDDEAADHVGRGRSGEIGAEEEDENEELGDEDDGEGDVDDDNEEDEEEAYGTEYSIRPLTNADDEVEASDFEPGEDEDEDDEIDDDEQEDIVPPSNSRKRKRSKDDSEDEKRHPKR